MSFEGKKVVITGGGTGIGYATARAAVSRGADVVILGRTETTLQQARASLGPTARYIVADMTDVVATDAAFAEIGSVDHLFTFAAIGVGGLFVNISEERMREFVESKLWGQYHAVKAALPRMASDGSMTLMSGFLDRKPLVERTPFAIVNGAIEALVKSLALEIAPIRINGLAPGRIDTTTKHASPAAYEAFVQHASARVPLKRPGTAAEVADAALFLAANTYVSGAVLDVDGGLA